MPNPLRRNRPIPPPEPVNPITGRPYGQPVPERDERTEAEIAAGQLALATAIPPTPLAAPFNPQPSAWRGRD